MTDIPEYDPTKDDMGAGEGAKGGGDDDTQDWHLTGAPGEAPAEPATKKSFWEQIEEKRGARPKYQKVPQSDKGYPMSKLPVEKKGIPSTSKGTAETSFIERANMPFRACFYHCRKTGNNGGRATFSRHGSQ